MKKVSERRTGGIARKRRAMQLLGVVLWIAVAVKLGRVAASAGFQCTFTPHLLQTSSRGARHCSPPRTWHPSPRRSPRMPPQNHGAPARPSTVLQLAPGPALTDATVQKGIDRIVAALRKDTRANTELGRLQKVTIVLGSGSPQPDVLAVRFNAAFQKSGPGLSSVPLPFGLGQSNVKDGRGTMVGQVKASVHVKTGKIVSCSVFRDLGYGRTFDLKV
jgi:hypothetical protein